MLGFAVIMLSLALHDDSYQPLAAERTALFGSAAYDTKQHFVDFITRFVAIIGDPQSVSPAMRNYLLTEGGLQARDGVPLGAQHMLYWLDKQLKDHKADLGYTNRLNESEGGVGWGEAAPDNRDDADPLLLHDELEGLGKFCIIIDNDAADDLDAGSLTGCVIPTYRGGSLHPCTTIGGTNKSNNSPTGGGLFDTTSELDYEYEFWNALDALHEGTGTTATRFPKVAGSEVFVLVRWATDHQIAREIVLLKNDDAAPHNARITIMGYPGEFPKIRMGNSTINCSDGGAGDRNDATMTTNNIGIASGGTARRAMITVGDTKVRDNVHFRNLWFSCNRDSSDTGEIYAGAALNFTSNATNCSVRHCKFSDFNPIRTDDYNIAGFAALIDQAYSFRTTKSPCAILSTASGLVIDSNEFEGCATADWPNDDNSAAWTIATSQGSTGGGTSGNIQFTTTATHDIEAGDFIVVSDGHTGWTGGVKVGRFEVASVGATTITTTTAWTGTGGTGGTLRVPVNPINVDGYGIDVGTGGDSNRITRNTFTGVKWQSWIRLVNVSSTYVAHNNFEGGCSQSLAWNICTNTLVEFNRFTGWGRDYDLATAGGGSTFFGGPAILPQGEGGNDTGTIIRYNVVFGAERMSPQTFGIWSKDTIVGAQVYGNIFYRCGIYLDRDDNGTQVTVDIDGNIIAGMPEGRKVYAFPAERLNAPVIVNFIDLSGDVPGTLNGQVTITDNLFWRFADATPDQSTIEAGGHVGVRNDSADDDSDFYEVGDTLAGFTGNVAEKPAWVGDPETGDFRVTSTLDFPASMPFRAADSQAWTAP